MLFSVIIPTYNRAHIIERCISSVRAQTYPQLEIIVVDDGSTDDTMTVVKSVSDDRIQYYFKANEERAVARNFGADKAKGDFLIFLDSDDQFKPHHLQCLFDFITNHPEKPEFVFSGYSVIDANHNEIYHKGASGKFRKKTLAYGNDPGCSAVTIKRSVFNNFKFSTDRNLILFEDWELWLRVIATYDLYCINSRTVIMENHTNRSVLNSSADQLSSKADALMKTTLHSVSFIKSSARMQKTLAMGVYSYVALHIALTGFEKKAAVKFLLKSVFINPAFLFKRRFLGIMKHLI